MKALLAVALALGIAASAAAKPPSWDRKIDGPGRFKVLAAFDGAAVLDKETGLVWQRAISPDTRVWTYAVGDCMSQLIGGRYGWRLPRMEELMSLLVEEHALPAGHPFTGIAPNQQIWSATTAFEQDGPASATALSVVLGNGTASTLKSVSLGYLCVRGGEGIADQ